MKVYEALHNSNTEESSPYTISIHLSKEGAEKAVEKNKAAEKASFDEIYPNGNEHYKWNAWQWWGINETEILP